MRDMITLDELLESMRQSGRAFGRRTREAQGKPPMPEPVFNGSNGYRDKEIEFLLEYERLAMLGRLRFSRQLTWQQFLDRKQDEIDRRRWNDS